MYNTKTRTLATVAVLTAATLVVGITFAATHSAFAYFPKKDDKKDKERDGGNDNGNTVTAQVNKQKESQSGWDNQQEQEAQNTICTHPGNTCTQEGAAAPRTRTTPPTPTPSNCNGVEDKVSSTDETDENSIGDPDTPQPPGVVCPQGEDEPADQEQGEVDPS